ncbi:MAG: extracellular solute-binding protein [Spirochaetia bacterium]|nr:extracellular solute-binding protein [Spirochaetia bacterium]
MRNLFLTILFFLVAFSQAIQFSQKKQKTGGSPVLYWLGLPNPDRPFQLRLFESWLSNRGLPKVEIRLDTLNQGISKVVVQGVAGVAGDMPEVYSGQLPILAQMGLLEPVDDVAGTFGLPETNYNPALHDDLYVDGKRYAYPCNMSVMLLLVNQNAFAKIGMSPPPYRWDFDTFEKMGRDFVSRANAASPGRRLHYFADYLNWSTLRRSLGVSHFNETLTGPALNDPRYRNLLERYKKWVFEDHIIPTQAEIASFAVDAGGFSGYSMQLFANGNFAMIYSGRHAVVQFRQSGKIIPLSVSEPPHGGYPNTAISSRMVTIFKGSKNIREAKQFLAFFTSRELNMHLVTEGDALTPVPGFTDLEEFVRPPGHENEWPLHQGFSRALRENPIPNEYSPFLLNTAVYLPLESKFLGGYMSGVTTAEEALARFDAEVKKEIKRSLSQHPELKSRYEEALVRQQKIDGIKKRGDKIPLDQVDNTFLKKYYRDMGMGQ